MSEADVDTKPAGVDIYARIPLQMLSALELYLRRGIWPGDGLGAVLTNDLSGCMQRWDDVVPLKLIYRYIWNRLPATAYGSEDDVIRWCQLTNEQRAKLLTYSDAHAIYFQRRISEAQP
jgi:hypothetical protein